ncbi:type II secretion system minor pseudopilin GspI [Ewingella americana]|uniref:type II secretion system minor pseudopilin GspI n=1 Tax=Ewingella americana TaxID=41202 RepID=UPI00189DEA64|nr:type II secretion system minor pseudopilin GspI [Ewingella americana]
MTKNNAAQQGMIMMEALLAVVLFVLVAIALLNVSGQAVTQGQQLLRTRCANWTADNLLVMEVLSPARRVMGKTQGEARQCDRNWFWTLTRQKTGDNRFYRVTLEIKNEDGQSQLERQILRPW